MIALLLRVVLCLGLGACTAEYAAVDSHGDTLSVREHVPDSCPSFLECKAACELARDLCMDAPIDPDDPESPAVGDVYFNAFYDCFHPPESGTYEECLQAAEEQCPEAAACFTTLDGCKEDCREGCNPPKGGKPDSPVIGAPL